jgi:hypothetical protein
MVNRPEVQAHLDKVRCIVRSDAEWEPVRLHEWNHAAEVCITLLDGTNFSASAPCAKGYPDKPLNSAEVMDKFRTCAGQILPANAVASLGQKILGIEAEENMTDIMSLASVALP